MWTHKFFCLSAVNTRTVPMSKGAKEALNAIGLGEKVVSMPSSASSTDLHHRLIETFPPLTFCGGYALLRCTGNTKTLELIEPPVGGHTLISLSSVVGQSRVYIRPLQQDIHVSTGIQGEVCTVGMRTEKWVWHIYFHSGPMHPSSHPTLRCLLIASTKFSV